MALWQEMKEDARAAQNRSAKVFIRASDISTIVVEKAEENCRRAGFGALLDDGRIVFHQATPVRLKRPKVLKGGLSSPIRLMVNNPTRRAPRLRQ